MHKLRSARVAGLLALLIITSVLCLNAQESANADPAAVFYSKVDLLSVAVRVTDHKDNEIHGLSAAQFSLYEDGKPQKIAFFDAEDEPVSLGILLDVSSSMALAGKLERSRDVLSHLLSTTRPTDEMFYLKFHRKLEKIVDFTSDAHVIESAISETRTTQDGTSLYDAVERALCYMRGAHHRKQALLVLTDGADENSHHSLEELIRTVQASKVQVFIIGIFSPQERGVYSSTHDEKIALVTNQDIDNPLRAFKQLAEESGAEPYFPSSIDNLGEVVDAVAHQLRTQYTLAYYSHSAAVGFRRIQVKVAQAHAQVRMRRGFGPLEDSADCEHEQLRSFPYEAKVTIEHGLAVYHEDFRDKASGWPSKKSFHYGEGNYQIARTEPASPTSDFSAHYSAYSQPGLPQVSGNADPAEGLLVANGPYFGDFEASVNVELKSSRPDNDMLSSAGLVFRLNDRGYYAVLITSAAPGSREIEFKVIKKYHDEQTAQDLLPWTKLPLTDLTIGPQKKISVRCRGTAITVLIQGVEAAKFGDDTFEQGLVGMTMYGVGHAAFQDLRAKELGPAK